jgi:hypothetical protein
MIQTIEDILGGSWQPASSNKSARRDVTHRQATPGSARRFRLTVPTRGYSSKL